MDDTRRRYKNREDRLARIMKRDRYNRRRRCEAGIGDRMGKRAYTSKGAAKRAASQISTQTERVFTPYLCPECGQWHLTTTPRRRP